MKALSIRQPWAHVILHLGKRVENRDWKGCAYRGAVLLHASSRVVLRPSAREPESFGDAVERVVEILKPAPGAARTALLAPFALLTPGGRAHAREAHGEPIWRPSPLLPLGGIVGRARIVDVLHMGGVPASGCAAKDPAATGDSPWYAGGFALVLDDVEPLPFIPWKGSLGFFDVPEAIVHEAVRRRDEPGQCPCETKLNNPAPHDRGCRNADPLLRAWTTAREREREAAAEERYLAGCENHRAAPC